MNIWFSEVAHVTIVSPTTYSKKLLTAPFSRTDIRAVSIPNMAFNSFGSAFKTLLNIPFIVLRMTLEMRKADHIHLRCPGNIGLMGCIVQVLFPKKQKTAKYAGNWDPNAQQPWSYRFQKWLLGNTIWTKNMKVLVYGAWPKQSKNILPFFTASYRKEKIKESIQRKIASPFRFVFVGSLSAGKRPLYAVRLVEGLIHHGFECTMDIYGDGDEYDSVTAYLQKNNLGDAIKLHGNQASEVVEKAYKKAHFMLLPSKSEGWPKVVAEAMFWGVIPIVTKISCVPWMLGTGERGILLDHIFEKDLTMVSQKLTDTESLQVISRNGQLWSHQYTLDDFETEIQKLL